jgi:hypothetical protein
MTACTFQVKSHGPIGTAIPDGVEEHLKENHFAPEDFEKTVEETATRNEPMRQLLALLREPPLPGQPAIPLMQLISDGVTRALAPRYAAIPFLRSRER